MAAGVSVSLPRVLLWAGPGSATPRGLGVVKPRDHVWSAAAPCESLGCSRRERRRCCRRRRARFQTTQVLLFLSSLSVQYMIPQRAESGTWWRDDPNPFYALLEERWWEVVKQRLA